MLAAELYVNSAQDDDDDVYENDSMPQHQQQQQQQTTVTNGLAGTLHSMANDADADDQGGVMEEEYENVSQIQRASAEPAPPTSNHDDNDDDRHIYQNVSRKPIPAPKPTSRF